MQLAIFTVLPHFMSESLNIWVAGTLIKLQKCDVRKYGNPLHFPLVSFRPVPTSQCTNSLSSQGYLIHSSIQVLILVFIFLFF